MIGVRRAADGHPRPYHETPQRSVVDPDWTWKVDNDNYAVLYTVSDFVLGVEETMVGSSKHIGIDDTHHG
ncbi:MAG: hypothetical protein MUF54_05425 [Polyangiaceae bacterium]|nr:hypothetical protein [Polyangiaceae bacterium]